MSSMDLELLDRVERMVGRVKEKTWERQNITMRCCVVGHEYVCISCSAAYDEDDRTKEEDRKHEEGCELLADITALESYIRIERPILEEEEYADG